MLYVCTMDCRGLSYDGLEFPLVAALAVEVEAIRLGVERPALGFVLVPELTLRDIG